MVAETFNPVSEADYWQRIEELVVYIRRLALEIASIDHPSGNMRFMIRMMRWEEDLIAELEGRFGVVVPTNGDESSIPPGKRSFWRWYEEMRNFCGTICSVCPLCKGLREGKIDCTVFPGIVNQLHAPGACAMLRLKGWDLERVEQVIRDRSLPGVGGFRHKMSQLAGSK